MQVNCNEQLSKELQLFRQGFQCIPGRPRAMADGYSSDTPSGAVEFFTLSGLILSTLVPPAAINGVGFAFKEYDQFWAAMDGKLGAYVRGEIGKRGRSGSGTTGFARPRRVQSQSRHRPTSPGLSCACRWPRYGPVCSRRSPTSINFSEVYSALQTHIAAGQENPLAVINAAKLYEVQKFCSLTNHMWDGFWCLANRRAFERLPADARDTITGELGRSAVDERQDVARLNADLQAKLAAAGLQFNQVEAAALRAQLQSAGFYKDWRGRFGDEAWGMLEATVGPLA